ncbi:HTH_Tnp_Tc3_1 domain-containing protein [Trichonephila clavipes]|nr:HTH_Tnp_Tc3_1 domain-containing protein [Trichonephila clavipes]
MTGYQDLSEFERGVIVAVREMGHSISEIAMKFEFSRTISSRVYREYRESGQTSKLRYRCGREKIMQERDQRQPTRIIKLDRCATLLQIAADFNDGPTTSVTMRTIQRNIIDMGFRSRRLTCVLSMTTRHKALRLAGAHQHRHSTVDDWKHVAWGTVHSLRIQTDLRNFLQDNATPHMSRITTEWLQKHPSEFRGFRRPPKSPDINIIEHILDALQRAVQKRSPPPLTPTDLWTALQDS